MHTQQQALCPSQDIHPWFDLFKQPCMSWGHVDVKQGSGDSWCCVRVQPGSTSTACGCMPQIEPQITAGPRPLALSPRPCIPGNEGKREIVWVLEGVVTDDHRPCLVT